MFPPVSLPAYPLRCRSCPRELREVADGRYEDRRRMTECASGFPHNPLTPPSDNKQSNSTTEQPV